MCLTAWGFPLLVPCIPSQPGSVLTRASASLLCSWLNWHRTSASQGHTLCYQRWSWSSLKRGQKTVRWFTSSKERYQKNRVVYADTYNLSLMTSIHSECHSNVHIHPLPAAVSVLWLKIFLSWPERLICIYMYLKF